MCGEYKLSSVTLFFSSGSPPHTWRILNPSGFNIIPVRITSTYVENTAQYDELLDFPQDHLHIRGEYSTVDLL